jgi:carboxymethylenebutenolidase
MKARTLLVIVATVTVIAGGRLVSGQHRMPLEPALAHRMAPASVLTRAGLPSEEMAKSALSAALMHRHPQYIDIPAGSATVKAFVIFPERGDHAPVLTITADNQGMSDWLRAVGDDAAANGFIAVVPDLAPQTKPDAVAASAIGMPASNGKGATVRFSFAGGTGRIVAQIAASADGARSFELTDHAWHSALAFLSGRLETVAQQQEGRAGRAGRAGGTGADAGLPMRGKKPELPANFLMALRTVAESPRKGEWVEIPMASGGKLHTWISYPQNVAKAPVVLVFQPGPGMDMGEPITRGGGANWLRAIADQLAYEGFIAVLPDLTSGLGPNGGNYDSFQYPDDSGAALNKIPHAEVIKRIQTAADYALKLPMANGKLGATGFCAGGGLAWEVAAEVPQVNASVIFYGGPPKEDVMARIHAPIAAFYGENDLGLAPQVAPATANMKRLGKEFTAEVYKEATHVFLYRQDLGRNGAATQDAWPKAMAFFKKHLTTASAAGH